MKAQVDEAAVQWKLTRQLALDGDFVMTIRLGFIYLVDWKPPCDLGGEDMPRYDLVNTKKKPFISTVDYTSPLPSQAGLILAFLFFIFTRWNGIANSHDVTHK